MLGKMKDLGNQLTTKAGEAVDSITTTVKEGASSLGDAAAGAVETLNEKAVRTSVERMCCILDIAADEVRKRSPANRPVTITASINVGVTALEMQVVLPGEEAK